MKKDSSGLIAVVLSALVFLGCGIWWYMSFDAVNNETTGLKIKLKAAKDARKAAEDKANKVTKQKSSLAGLVGMNASVEGEPSTRAMAEHLNVWAKRLNAMPGTLAKYGEWAFEDDGTPKFSPGAEAAGRELNWIKDVRSPVNLMVANETKDLRQYLLAELEDLKAAMELEAGTLEQEAVRAIQSHNENVGDGKSGGRLAQVVDEKERRIKELREAIKNIEEQIATNARGAETQIADLEKEVRTKLDEIDAVKDKQEKLTSEKRRKIQELFDRVFAISTKRQLARESTEADGKVINSIPSELTFWIDIGRKDALLRGTRFEVFAMNKGGRKVAKGTAVVIEVKGDYAVCSVLRDALVSLNDGTVYEGKVVENGPVVEITERNGGKAMVPADKVKRLDYLSEVARVEKGDFVANEVFDRNRAKTFVFGGKLRGRYTNEQMGYLIKEFGGLIAGDVVNETTYLVVGADFEKDPNFEKAKNLGVKIIREQDLYEMLGLEK